MPIDGSNVIELRVKPTKVKQFLMKAMPVILLIKNISKEPIRISDNSIEIDYIEDGEKMNGYDVWSSDENYICIEPGETYEMELQKKRLFEFKTTYNSRQAVESFTFGVHAVFRHDDKTRIFCESLNTLDLEIDYTQTEILKTPSGEDSCYMKYNGDIVYISKFSRAYEQAVKKINIDKENYKILDDSYIVDGSRVFRNGNVQRINPNGFKIYNELFAGNDEMVLTSYGDAKVKDPKSFEVFNVYGNSYKKGYARDKYQLYFFDTGGGTSHARIIKACKNPSTFKELYAIKEESDVMGEKYESWEIYGQCERTVYIDATSISLCDASSWQKMGRFSKDKKNAFYFTYKLKNADVSSFELIPDPEKTDEYNTLEKSRWAKDKNHYYHCGDIVTKEKYEAAIKEALEDEE